MKLKKILATTLAFAMIFSFIAVTPVVAVDITGDGTIDSPLQIGTAEQLLEFKSRVDNGETSLCAVLTADIEVTDDWASIAAGGLKVGISDSTVPYVGTFDGNGKTLTLKKEDTTTAGRAIALFHTIGIEGVVKNLNLDLTFKGHSYMAGVAVRNYGTIESVTATGVVMPKPAAGSAVYAAGIVVYNGCKEVNGQYVPGKIFNCVNLAEIGINMTSTISEISGQLSGGTNLAGIAATFTGEMRNCANYGTIWAITTGPAGGLFCLPSGADGPAANGEPIKQVIVSDCYNAGTVNIVGTTASANSVAGLFGATTDNYYITWVSTGKFAISNVFNYGTVQNPYKSLSPDNSKAIIIGLGTVSTFTDLHVLAAFSNIYYLPESGTRIFGAGHVAGDDGWGTANAKTVIHPGTAAEFASADMAAALNNGRTGASAPWEYVADNDYPTLKFEREDYDPNDDIYIPEPDVIDIDFGYGGEITVTQDEDGQYTVSVTVDDYVIDTISVDGVRLDNVQGETTFTTTVAPTRSIFATFAYTVNFPNPANGTLSVSRESELLTSGSIVRAGEILTVSYTGTDELILNGFERIGDTDQYKVVARRDAPPSISFETATTPDPVDKTALETAIELAETKVETEYTSNSWSALQSALSAAQTVEDNADATESDVTDATAALTEAINALVPRADKTALTGAIEAATAYTESEYTQESWQALAEALIVAQGVLEDNNATPGDVSGAVSAINNAIAELVAATPPEEPADKTALTEAIEEAAELIETDYTPNSWSVLQSALTTAQTVAANDSATQEQVTNAASALVSAINSLIPRADKSALTGAIEEAAAYVESDYTPASWQALTSALFAAQGVLANDNATPGEVADAVSAINNAIAELVTVTLPEEPVDKTALTGAIEAATAYAESDSILRNHGKRWHRR
ncbi:MAG: FIVAR domain-containing protein [Treponema sp.]|jgi:hypothetical protein|nr:FIVAR domain-containing protein [Treponema sp.]